jgi:hypothetical protein
MRRFLGAALVASSVLAGCSHEVRFERKSLDQAQTRNELQGLGITIPNSYSFVSMTKMPPPGSGGSSYDGVYDSPTPPAPVLVDGTPLPMTPTTCQQLRRSDLPDGLNCALASGLRHGSIRLTKSADSFGVVSAKLSSGKSRVYISVSGH